MSLKGYQWTNDEGKVVMSFTFKDLTLDIWESVSEKEINKFKEYISSNGFEVLHIVDHYISQKVTDKFNRFLNGEL